MTRTHSVFAKTPYELFEDGRFVIRNYNEQKPFSNFLPGIAGFYGIPMWVFTVNRGQAVASFGTRNKDNAILEFYPANKAYQAVPNLGFRTFLKIKRGTKAFTHEPFRPASANAAYTPEQSMEITAHELAIEEKHVQAGLMTSVRYFTVPGEPIAALAREITLTNISQDEIEIEMLDGLPSVNPYGMNEFFVKHMSRTIEAWMITENLSKKAPFFRLKVDATDRPEVVAIKEGNFFFGVSSDGGRGKLLDPIVDPGVVFGPRLDFEEPKPFYETPSFKAPSRQMADNKTPCAFVAASFHLGPGKSRTLRSYYGQADHLETLNRFVARALGPAFYSEKRTENRTTLEAIKGRLFSVTSSSAYDLYCGQTYLDNIMRGGMPVVAGEDFLFYVYSRKHGDLERDYNRFLVEPTYFSQGDGNYRDVNQNRRNDVWFEPRVGDANIRTFLNLIQLDGFNPLVIKGAQFHFRRSPASAKMLRSFFGSHDKKAAAFLAHPFRPGSFYAFLEAEGLVTRAAFPRLLSAMAPFVRREDEAEHGEGFWVDHWTYNLDLIESYLAIFPEHQTKLLFDSRDYTFYDNDHRVRSRAEKYVLKTSHVVRQYGSVVKDKQKTALIASRDREASHVRTRAGKGDVYRTTLFVKLICLFANKFASLDASGAGIEMEADKPSWYDALNGLPGLLGSSLSETYELKRLALFMIQAIDESMRLHESVLVPEELFAFVNRLDASLDRHLADKSAGRNFRFWEEATAVKERYRTEVFSGVSGKDKKLDLVAVKGFLEHAREKVDMGLERAVDPATHMVPTYFENRAARFRPFKLKTQDGSGRAGAEVTEFAQSALPYFLEGPVHALKLEKDPARRRELLKAVRSSRLYDAKLGMYKVNAPIDSASLEIGRARVFAPGWLENESIWLHMEYKFMLELLKAGMAEEFFADFKKALVPFQPPTRYGRSVLENSSFIVSSAFQDASLHGTGFVARLSGSTAEFLTMWLVMNIGKRPFILGPDGKLSLRFQPTLPESLFVKQDTVRTFTAADGRQAAVKVPKDALAFLFLGKTLIVYHNPRRLDTFGRQRVSVKKTTLRPLRGGPVEFRGDTIPSPYAGKVRDGLVPRIDIELG